MMNFAYLIGDDGTGVCAAVDPGWDATTIAGTAKEAGFKIVSILLTHAHFDHAQALDELVALTGAEVYLNGDEAGAISKKADVHTTQDGTVIQIGQIKATCIHTPGHTPGSQCFLVDGAVFTGDTLFVDGCGRVDLPGSDPHAMLTSLKRLAALPPETIIYPGHNYGHSPTATIGEQKKTNPCLSAESGRYLL